MRHLGHLIVRLVSIGMGFVLAILAAALFLSLGIISDVVLPVMRDATGEPPQGGWITLLAGVIAWPWLAAAAAMPASILIAAGELMRWRGLVTNLVMGGLASLFAGWTWLGLEDPRQIGEGVLLVLASAGFVAGFVYWLVAGRAAGKWLETPTG
ncbi:MAG: hypothetical protein WBO55_12720 [Rhizobiaceae bacterium]